MFALRSVSSRQCIAVIAYRMFVFSIGLSLFIGSVRYVVSVLIILFSFMVFVFPFFCVVVFVAPGFFVLVGCFVDVVVDGFLVVVNEVIIVEMICRFCKHCGTCKTKG